MSQRFLKYETEVENGMVDENGVLVPGGGLIVDLSHLGSSPTSDTVIDDMSIGVKIIEAIRNGSNVYLLFVNSYTEVIKATVYTDTATIDDVYYENALKLQVGFAKPGWSSNVTIMTMEFLISLE